MIARLKNNSLNMLHYGLLATMLLLPACSSIGDMFGGSDESDNMTDITPTLEDEGFVDIMRDSHQLNEDMRHVENLSLSEPTYPETWKQEGGNTKNNSGHMNSAPLEDVIDFVTIGDGYDWIPAAIAPSAITNSKIVVAMDGRGIVSAFDAMDIDEELWTSKVLKSSAPLLTGGLAMNESHIFALSGRGKLVALDINSGDVTWGHTLEQPVRSSLRLADGYLFVITADSQIFCYNIHDGSLAWQHRGIGETDGLFGTSLPAVQDDGVLVAYPSGEIFRLQLDDGSMIWNGVLARPRRTMAIGLFSGVDANPVADGPLVYSASTSGLLVADDAESGLRFWELPVGMRHSPAIDEDLIFAVTEHGDLIAINKYLGRVGWKISLLDDDHSDNDNHVMPRFYGPFIVNETIMVFDHEGTIYQYTPITGNVIRHESLVKTIAASPSFTPDSAYFVSSDATLYKVQ